MNSRTTLSTAIRVTWCVLFGAVLTFAWVQREIHDMPVAATLFLMGLSLPVGPLFLAFTGTTLSSLAGNFDVPYYAFRDFVPYWLCAGLTVYIQWFWLMPKILKFLAERWRRRQSA